jgi:hypothetical protein
VSEKSFFDQLDEKVQEFDCAIQVGEDMINGLRAQRDLVVTIRDAVLGVEANSALYQGKIEEFQREQS